MGPDPDRAFHGESTVEKGSGKGFEGVTDTKREIYIGG